MDILNEGPFHGNAQTKVPKQDFILYEATYKLPEFLFLHISIEELVDVS